MKHQSYKAKEQVYQLHSLQNQTHLLLPMSFAESLSSQPKKIQNNHKSHEQKTIVSKELKRISKLLI